MSGFVLKMIALVLMVADHVAELFPGLPLWLHWLGRLSAPLFFFCLAVGLTHTHSRAHYTLRLLLASCVMHAGNMLLAWFFPYPQVPIQNNIFETMCLVATVAYIAEVYAKSKKERYAAADGLCCGAAAAGAFAACFTGECVRFAALCTQRIVVRGRCAVGGAGRMDVPYGGR